MDSKVKFELITRHLQEVLGGDIIKSILDEGRNVRCYWGSAPTGRPHMGYFVPLTKIADFLHAGTEVTILLADVHAFLDNMKAPLDLVKHRVAYYEAMLRAIFKSIPVPVDKLKFVVGSSYQLTEKYNLDNYKLCATVTEHDAKKAGAEVVKQVSSPLLSGLLYPGLQALDEEYLDCDFQFGGVDQRKIFTFAELYLPKLGYRKRAHLMNAMVPGLAGGKMSSSDPNSKIDILDPPATIAKKIKSAFCEEGNVAENGLLAFTKTVLIPINMLRLELLASQGSETASTPVPQPFVSEGAPKGTLFSIALDEKRGGGGQLNYSSYDALEADFADKKIHPKDLKDAVAKAITSLLEPIQRDLEQQENWKETVALAYPSTEPVKKKKEKVYHPPPPGKGKAAKSAEDPVTPATGAADKNTAETLKTPSQSKPGPDGLLSEVREGS